MARLPEDLLKLKLGNSYDLMDKGTVVTLNLLENNYDTNIDRMKLRQLFMNKLVEWNNGEYNGVYIIKGIESHAAMNVRHENVGLLLQKWGLYHPLPKGTIIPKYNKEDFKLPK